MTKRQRKKQLKFAWERIANKLPAVLPTRREKKEWVSASVNAALRERYGA